MSAPAMDKDALRATQGTVMGSEARGSVSLSTWEVCPDARHRLRLT